MKDWILIFSFTLVAAFFLIKADGIKIGLIRLAYIIGLGAAVLFLKNWSDLYGSVALIILVLGYFFLNKMLRIK